MRKYVFNGAVLSAVMGLWTTIQSTRSGVRDWRVPLLWISAALSLAIAIGTVVEDSKDAAEREAKPLGSRKGS